MNLNIYKRLYYSSLEMVVEKRDENVKGRLSIQSGREHGETRGSFEYEFTVPNMIPSPDPRQQFTIMGLPVQRDSETRKGMFVVLQDNRAISTLSYLVIYSSVPEFESSIAKLAIMEQYPGKDYLNDAIYHNFENGAYTHSEILPGSSVFEQVQLPSGLSLCRYPDHKEEIAARQEAHRNPTMDSFKKAEEIEELHRKQTERAKNLQVIIEDFQIPELIRKELQSTEYPLINLLIGKYL
jgi:hypothetical protein